MEKTVKEVFKDYNSNSFELNEAKIKGVNLFKKTGKIEIILIANKQIKTIVGYIVQIELPDRFNTEWGVAKIKQINKKLKEMIKCAEVKIVRHKYQDYLWIIYK